MITDKLDEDSSTIAQLLVDPGHPWAGNHCYQYGSLISKGDFNIKDIWWESIGSQVQGICFPT